MKQRRPGLRQAELDAQSGQVRHRRRAQPGVGLGVGLAGLTGLALYG
jgi:hypothetical protein